MGVPHKEIVVFTSPVHKEILDDRIVYVCRCEIGHDHYLAEEVTNGQL